MREGAKSRRTQFFLRGGLPPRSSLTFLIFPNASIEGTARILPSIPHATHYWLSTTTLQIFG
jgi:hypothetical protein